MGVVGITVIGIVIAFLWILSTERAKALGVYWADRINEIEQILKIPRTFRRERYNAFWKNRNWFERRRISAWAVLSPIAFLGIWSILLYFSTNILQLY